MRRRRSGSGDDALLVVIATIGGGVLASSAWFQTVAFFERNSLLATNMTGFIATLVLFAVSGIIVGCVSFLLVRRVYRFVLQYKNEIEDGKRYEFIRAVSHTDSMSDREFESFVEYVLRRAGYADVAATPLTNDEGIDHFFSDDGKRVAVQVKHYNPKNKIGRPDLQKFVGAFQHIADEGWFVTSSYFTPGAHAYAVAFPNLRLIDRMQLGEMIEQLPDNDWMLMFNQT